MTTISVASPSLFPSSEAGRHMESLLMSPTKTWWHLWQQIDRNMIFNSDNNRVNKIQKLTSDCHPNKKTNWLMIIISITVTTIGNLITSIINNHHVCAWIIFSLISNSNLKTKRQTQRSESMKLSWSDERKTVAPNLTSTLAVWLANDWKKTCRLLRVLMDSHLICTTQLLEFYAEVTIDDGRKSDGWLTTWTILSIKQLDVIQNDKSWNPHLTLAFFLPFILSIQHKTTSNFSRIFSKSPILHQKNTCSQPSD